MTVPFTPIDSSMLSGHHYDADSRKLTVQFKNGLTYEYDDVPIEKHMTMVENASPGRYFNQRIKGTHMGRKV